MSRREDSRFLRGEGKYLADITRSGFAEVAILRSTVAHGRIRSVELENARNLKGVTAVLHGGEIQKLCRPFSHLIPSEDAKPLRWWPLAVDTVRFVGEPVAVAVASTRALAEDALDLIEIEYEPLEWVCEAHAALADGAPLLFPEWETNEMFSLKWGTDDFEAQMNSAEHRLKRRIESHRITAAPLEGHGVAASFDAIDQRLTVWASAQQPHQLRSVLAEILDMKESKLRVIAPDIGGGFGNKQHFTREQALVALLGRELKLPLRWIEDRLESLIASIHARAQTHDVEVGYNGDGKVIALRARIVADLGNPMLYFSGIGPAVVTSASLTGGYGIEHAQVDLSCVATNTCPVGAYRGFGQPEAHNVTERIMDLVAAKLHMDPAQVRRLNLIGDAPRPYLAPSGASIDTGPLCSQFDRLLEAAGYSGLRKWQEQQRCAGRLVGLGLSSLVQGTSPTQHDVAGRFGSWEAAEVSVLPDGSVTLSVGTKSQGQGHETVFAKLAATVLGTSPDNVQVTQGDTDSIPYGMGTWGSRSAVMGGGAVLLAAQSVADKMKVLAGEMLEIKPSEVVRERGQFSATDDAGTTVSFEEVAARAWWHTNRLVAGTSPGLSSTSFYTPGRTLNGDESAANNNHDETYGSHMTLLVIEVSKLTGDVQILDAFVIADCGTIIDHSIVKGQLQGGFAQGLGAALLEEVLYDQAGHPLRDSFAGYSIAQASEVPPLRVEFRETPSDTLGGFRGVGEAGTIFTPAALVSAVNDALGPLGISIDSTRLGARHLRPQIRFAVRQLDNQTAAGQPTCS